MEIAWSEARSNAQKGLSGKESHVVRVVGSTWTDFLGAFGAGKDG
jgi:hypothetical protein